MVSTNKQYSQKKNNNNKNDQQQITTKIRIILLIHDRPVKSTGMDAKGFVPLKDYFCFQLSK